MNYATTCNIGNNKNTRRKKAKAVEPTTARLRPLDEADKGHAGNQKRQKEIGSYIDAPNGFLKTRFLPKLKEEHSLQVFQENEHLERDFYSSLSQLSAHYGLIPFDITPFPFPYNMTLSLWNTKIQLKARFASVDCMELVQEEDRYFLKTEERCRTGGTLFYIPVAPLYMMLKDKQRRKTAQLLLSVCSYLYHIADIPYYRQEDSYLYWQYEMMRDWVEQDEEFEERQDDIAELQKAVWIGDHIEQKIYNRKTLSAFQYRLNSFKADDPFDEECLQCAKLAFNLYNDYPQESIFRNSILMNKDIDSDEIDEVIPMEKYISFWAESKSFISESLTECINNEFNEYGEIDEPTVFKIFNGKPLPVKDLNFETRLFDLLDELIYLLNNYKKQKNGNHK
ncbi:MAG: hypothetical protein J7577_22950 [Sphingobacteriaceae bacterium]|nr:hypothetical protein [Sphingobacteriaceae bacterium]